MAYEPPFYAIRTIFIGAGGDLQFIEFWVLLVVDIRYASLGPIFLETLRNPDN